MPITTSIFDLFKIGPGPSSSHTIGPMTAGFDFIRLASELDPTVLARAQSIEVRLFGSLSATGKGHGTDRAVLAGLLGNTPANCPTEFMEKLADPATHHIKINDIKLPVSLEDVIYDKVDHSFPYNNTLIIKLVSADESLLEREYHSVGGGFIQWREWEPEKRGKACHIYTSADEALALVDEKSISIDQMMMDNEIAITGASRNDVVEGLNQIIQAMDESVDRGLTTRGVLPGPIGLRRKAPSIQSRSQNLALGHGKLLCSIDAYAFAASEENAAGHRVVTAPTSGASGVLPALVRIMRELHDVNQDGIRKGLMAAALVGFLCKHNASIAGADVGCQGEIGVASAMGAAMLSHATGLSADTTLNAAETALEHHLGLTCDPVGGYVQIPCIERNAMGALKAYNAFVIATAEPSSFHMVGLDQAIRAMAQTGRDMCHKYKETGLGGLAVCVVEC